MSRTVWPQACRCETALLPVLQMPAVQRLSIVKLPGASPTSSSDLLQALRQAANGQMSCLIGRPELALHPPEPPKSALVPIRRPCVRW